MQGSCRLRLVATRLRNGEIGRLAKIERPERGRATSRARPEGQVLSGGDKKCHFGGGARSVNWRRRARVEPLTRAINKDIEGVTMQRWECRAIHSALLAALLLGSGAQAQEFKPFARANITESQWQAYFDEVERSMASRP